MTPTAINTALEEAWLPRSVASSIRKQTLDPTNCNDRDRWYEVIGYSLVNGFSVEEANEAVRILEILNESASRDFCAKEVGRLKVLTKTAKQDSDDMMFQIAVMAEELSAYPADVVRDVCRSWPCFSTWFPSWAELYEPAERYVKMRRHLLKALRRGLSRREQIAPPDAIKSM
jgi:hypothetical protein